MHAHAKKKIPLLLLTILAFLSLGLLYSNQQTDTKTATPVIDVVIPCHEKDIRTLELAIEGIKKYGTGIRRVITVSSKRLTDKAEWFDEASYPFSKQDIAYAIFKDKEAAEQYYQHGSRLGWIYQQLLKLYAPIVIPDISSQVLILDADTIFLRETTFIDDEGYALFNVGREYHPPYFDHARRLLPDFKKVYSHYSGICHHMLLQRPIIDDLFNAIRSTHNTEPWQALCACIDHQYTGKDLSGLSEYEIYFNFVFSKKYKVKIRELKWANIPFSTSSILAHTVQGAHYVSCHSYI